MRGLLASAVVGCLLTLVCWAVATLISLGWIIGDCMGGPEQGCPADHERDMAVLRIVLVAAFVNTAGIFLIGYIYARRRRP